MTLYATGKLCALCDRVAASPGIAVVCFAVDRDAVAEWGVDYQAGYDTDRPPLVATAKRLAGERGRVPFTRYLGLHRSDFTTRS